MSEPREVKLEGPGRDEAFELLMQVARFMGGVLGYTYKLEGWSMLMVRPNGTPAMRVTAKTETEVAELKALVLASEAAKGTT